MLLIALIAAAALLAGVLLQLRSREPAGAAIHGAASVSMLSENVQQPPPASSPRQAPQAVALVLRVQNPACACDNARKFADKTFLVADAPKLPFKDCTRADCLCRYERVAERRRTRGDRRVTSNRREEIRFEMKDDRRSGKDRRQTNNVWKQPI